LKDDFSLPGAPADSIRLAVGVCDDVIGHIARSVLSEVASLTLAARLLRNHCDSGACAPLNFPEHGLERTRLRRVLDYIAAHIKEDIALADLPRLQVTVHFILHVGSHLPWASLRIAT
jgi:AraC family transcriptional regulator